MKKTYFCSDKSRNVGADASLYTYKVQDTMNGEILVVKPVQIR